MRNRCFGCVRNGVVLSLVCFIACACVQLCLFALSTNWYWLKDSAPDRWSTAPSPRRLNAWLENQLVRKQRRGHSWNHTSYTWEWIEGVYCIYRNNHFATHHRTASAELFRDRQTDDNNIVLFVSCRCLAVIYVLECCISRIPCSNRWCLHAYLFQMCFSCRTISSLPSCVFGDLEQSAGNLEYKRVLVVLRAMCTIYYYGRGKEPPSAETNRVHSLAAAPFQFILI